MIRRLNVEYRESASNDLGSIFRYIVESGGSPEVAMRFVLRIEDRCHRQCASRRPLPRRHHARTANGSVRAFRRHRLYCRRRSRLHRQHLLRRSRL
ncbi:type II toxin-antitoxin system RelE/ParE family toxin [Mesorhizobium sp. 2RAF45]